MPQRDDDEDPTAPLDGIELKFFTASPTSIGPFGASILRWEVVGVKPRVSVVLDYVREVSAAGQAAVRPQTSHTYVLAAKTGSGPREVTQVLGSTRVEVDLSMCAQEELMSAFARMRAAAYEDIAAMDDIHWSYRPFGGPNLIIEATGNQIHFRFILRRHINNAPDLWVTLEGRFGLGVVDGQYVAVGRWSKGTAEWPRWFWFLSGIIGGLALAFNHAQEKAAEKADEVIDALIELLNFLKYPGEGRTVRSATVTTRNGESVIDQFVCADTELHLIADAIGDGQD